MANDRYPIDDPKIIRFIKRLETTMEYFYFSSCLPWLNYIAPQITKINVINSHARDIKAMFEKVVQEQKDIMNPDGDPRNFIEAYLQEMRLPGNEGMKEEQLVGMITDFFEAGGETVGTTLSWIILFLVLNQDVQRRCREEIDNSGIGKFPKYSDRNKLPFVEATIMEVQRMACVAPGGLEHITREHIKDFHGYEVPKNTFVLYNIYHFHHDPEVWADPLEFKPERFLIKEGSELKVVKKEQFVSFWLG